MKGKLSCGEIVYFEEGDQHAFLLCTKPSDEGASYFEGTVMFAEDSTGVHFSGLHQSWHKEKYKILDKPLTLSVTPKVKPEEIDTNMDAMLEALDALAKCTD